MTSLILQVRPAWELTDEQFQTLCANNSELRLEKTAKGELVLMAPASSESGERNASVSAQLWLWNRSSKLGRVFDSSTGFKLANGAIRSPDAAWIKHERWDGLTAEEKRGFAAICPDFVIELRSPSDRLADVQAKMCEYLENGILLGWLIDPQTNCVAIYVPGQATEVLFAPKILLGTTVLPEFVLDLQDIL